MSQEKKVEPAPLVPPFVRFVASAIPMVFDNSLSYYECLAALTKYLQDVVKVINNNAAVTEEYIQMTKDMKSYMDNYFENLDVQEEINNKLDQMTLDGTLQEIIAEYIQANVAWTFDTVADMKSATNLVSGSYAQTLGFHTLNDGGGAIYKITDSGTANEMDVIAVGELYANIVCPSELKIEMLGAYGDGIEDDTDYFDRALEYIKDKNIPLVLTKTYKITNEITTTNADNITIYGNNATLNVLTSVAFYFSTINNLTIKDLNVNGSVEDNQPIGALAHALNANNVNISNINAKELAYVYKNDYQLTNDNTQFITKEIRFTNINAEDCEVLLLAGFVDNLVVENIFNTNPNGYTRELFYLLGGIVNGYFNNIDSDSCSRWPFHFNVSGGSYDWDLSLDINKIQRIFINNVNIGSAYCILHFNLYCKKVYVSNLICSSPIYEVNNTYTCEEIYINDSTTNMISGETAGTVNKVVFDNCNINGRTNLAKNTEVYVNNSNWASDVTTNVFFAYVTAGKLSVRNSKIVNNSSTAQQVFQTNNGVTIELVNNKVQLNQANRFVTMVDDTDKSIIYGNIIEATSLNALNNKTPYIKFGNYINGSAV